MVDQDTLAVLVNAIYFDAKWKSEFMTKDTVDTCFYSYPGYQCQKIPMMYKEFDFYYKFDNSLESHVVQIPYQVVIIFFLLHLLTFLSYFATSRNIYLPSIYHNSLDYEFYIN